MSVASSVEWGTDYWGEVLTEPSEEHARQVAQAGQAAVYSRQPGGAWEVES